jgi:hypothetical protein
MQTQFELKPLSRQGVAAALEKATRYRFLNEPGEAESICHDVLRIDEGNQQALVILLLALTDRFNRGYGVGATQARELLPRLKHAYERDYYGGIISEREAKARLQRASPGCGCEAYELLRDAMACYERAEAMRPAGNDDALLRWNACARIIMENRLHPREDERVEMQLE